MADKSQIEWTEATWNPVTGCTKISAGCKNCYAERLAMRLKAMGNARYRNGFDVTLHEDVLELLLGDQTQHNRQTHRRFYEPEIFLVRYIEEFWHAPPKHQHCTA